LHINIRNACGAAPAGPIAALADPLKEVSMSLKLYLHPLASYCQKALIAFYENGAPFEPIFVDLGNEASSAELKRLWPIGKFPVLRDEARGQTVPESSIIIEYLDRYYPGRAKLLPEDAELAWQTRLKDRFYDLHLHEHMQKVVGDRLRPQDKRDPFGVAHAKASIERAYDMIDAEMGAKTWAMGEAFGMADCAAAPALFYAKLTVPFGDARPKLSAYFERLANRPSFARATEEAKPYFAFFPKE
jgi:glutathione S-transferase